MRRWSPRVLALCVMAVSALAARVQAQTNVVSTGELKMPWTVAIRPSAKAVAIGDCPLVYIDLTDHTGKDIPRRPGGMRVSLADFDWSAAGEAPNSSVGIYDGPNAWNVCACQGAVIGSPITITATYPARSLPDKVRVPGLAFRSTTQIPIMKAYGTSNPRGCDAQPPAPVAVAAAPLHPVEVAAGRGVPATSGTPTVAPPLSAPTATTALSAPAAVPTATSGRYRIVANGFRVLHETKDDLLSRDGKGDEVYGAFTMFHFDRHTGTLLDRDLRRTLVIGDILNFPGRIKGGSWSATGGFRASDAYPGVGDPSMRHGPPSRDSFPFLIWDGPLADGQDAVIILPTIWEYDGGTAAYDQWFLRELADQHTIWTDVGVQEMIAGHQLGVVLSSRERGAPGGISATATAGFQTMLLQIGAMFGVTPFDRPLGMKSVGGFAVLPRRAIVITREIIEASLQQLASTPTTDADALSRAATALIDLQRMVADVGTSSGTTTGSSAQPNGGMPYGTIAIPLIDGPGSDFQGQYVMYIQVERIP